MERKVIIINVPIYNLKDGAEYGFVEIKELETYVKDGWEVRAVTPVIPNQGGNHSISNIQYLIQLAK